MPHSEVMSGERTSSSGTRIRSVEKAAAVLMLVASRPEEGSTAKALAEDLGFSVPTTHHLLNTLVDARLVAHDEDRRYRLGLAFELLTTAYQRQTTLPPELVGPLETLTEETGESAYLCGMRQGDLEILAHRVGTHAVRVMDLRPGFHGAIHARASGKVLLAFGPPEVRDRCLSGELRQITPHTITNRDDLLADLEKTVLQGYSVEEEEFCEGVSCLSVPIFDKGSFIGAYTIAAPVDRCRSQSARYLACLRRAAEAVTAEPSFPRRQGS